VAIKVAPQIGIAVNKRDEQPKEFIAVPVEVALQATHELAVFLDTGAFGPKNEFSQEYAVPVGVGAAFAVMPILDVGAEFMLPLARTGNKDNKAFDTRTVMIYAAFILLVPGIASRPHLIKLGRRSHALLRSKQTRAAGGGLCCVQ
jgi:hypothetical protein